MGNAPEVSASGAKTCSIKPQNLPRPKTISVDGVPIPRDAIARETQNHPAAKPVDAWKAAARALVVRQLLLQEAHRRGITAAPVADSEGRRETADEAVIRSLIDTAIVTPEPDEEACRRSYGANQSRFRSSDIFEVRHILIAAHPDDRAARRDAKRSAEQLIDRIASQPDLFSGLAAEYSRCPSGMTGGSLGQVSKGQAVPEFEIALASAPVGQVAPAPIESRYGYHVVHVDRHIPGAQLPFEIAKTQIAEWLVAKSRHIGIRTFISDLVRLAKIEGIEFDLEST